MCNSSAPNPPDPTTIANATTKSNEDTAAFQTGLNAVDQTGPNGSLTYTSTPGKNGAPPQYTATTTYSPAVQKIMNALQQGQQSIASAGAKQATGLGKSLASVAAPTLATSLGGSGNISQDQQKYEDTLFGQLDTQSGKDQATLESQLAQQGIARGSDAYTRAMDDFQKSKTANRTSAILNAGTFGQQEQNRALTAGNFGNQAIQQNFQNAIGANNQNINQTLALENGAPVQQPSFGSTPQTGVTPTNVAGIAQNGYDQQMAAYNSGQQQLGGMFGTLGTLGSTLAPYLFSLSDERTKKDVERVGKTDEGIPIYTYRFKSEGDHTPKRMGVMAQEAAKVHPEAVKKIGGIFHVNYSELGRAA